MQTQQKGCAEKPRLLPNCSLVFFAQMKCLGAAAGFVSEYHSAAYVQAVKYQAGLWESTEASPHASLAVEGGQTVVASSSCPKGSVYCEL